MNKPAPGSAGSVAATWTRRGVLAGLSALTLAGGRLAWAGAGDRKLGVIVLRGGLDGLAAVAPWQDGRYRALRGELALAAPGEPGGVLDLGEGFGLHPSLGFLGERWAAGELAVMHAAATPYRERSHFDGQDVLERGALSGPDEGWLSRAVVARGGSAVGIGVTLPLLLRGGADATTWAPSRVPGVDEGTLDRLADLYASNPVFAEELSRARATGALLAASDAPDRKGRGAEAISGVVQAAATLLNAPGGPSAAVIGVDGWDTHANQGAAEGGLARRLAALDAGLRAFREEAGATWGSTVILVLTEFGRTARVNGTGGTDHGTGGVAFAVGGAVRGGFIGDWPGLADLHEDRDLRPANDVRGLVASVLRDHWGVEGVLPGAAPVGRPVRG